LADDAPDDSDRFARYAGGIILPSRRSSVGVAEAVDVAGVAETTIGDADMEKKGVEARATATRTKEENVARMITTSASVSKGRMLLRKGKKKSV